MAEQNEFLFLAEQLWLLESDKDFCTEKYFINYGKSFISVDFPNIKVSMFRKEHQQAAPLFIFSSFTTFLRHSNYPRVLVPPDTYIVRCVIKRTQRNCMKRLVKGVWFMTTFYCSLKLIFTIVDDICLQLIRKRSRSLFSSHEMIFLSSAVKRAETSRKTISIFVLKHSRVGCFSPFCAKTRQFVNEHKTTN